MQVFIVDLGLNNLASVTNAFARLGTLPNVITTGVELEHVSKGLVVLPGNGNFGAACQKLDILELREALVNLRGSNNVTVLGICLGMQLLFESSEEAVGEGLGLIEGNVTGWTHTEKRTHIGWSSVMSSVDDFSPDTLPEDFYFVHSFQCKPRFAAHKWLESTFDKELFVSGVRSENILGVQFHPEKSSDAGHNLIKWIVGTLNA